MQSPEESFFLNPNVFQAEEEISVGEGGSPLNIRCPPLLPQRYFLSSWFAYFLQEGGRFSQIIATQEKDNSPVLHPDLPKFEMPRK